MRRTSSNLSLGLFEYSWTHLPNLSAKLYVKMTVFIHSEAPAGQAFSIGNSILWQSPLAQPYHVQFHSSNVEARRIPKSRCVDCV